jgi:hypothetical protein
MKFKAEKSLSEQDKHPLLIYRSTANPERYFKFCHKRDNKNTRAYICLGCQEAKDAGNEISVIFSSRTLFYVHKKMGSVLLSC